MRRSWCQSFGDHLHAGDVGGVDPYDGYTPEEQHGSFTSDMASKCEVGVVDLGSRSVGSNCKRTLLSLFVEA